MPLARSRAIIPRSVSAAKRALSRLRASDGLLVAACADRDRHTVCVGNVLRDGKLWTLQTRVLAAGGSPSPPPPRHLGLTPAVRPRPTDDTFPPHDALRQRASDMLRDVSPYGVRGLQTPLLPSSR